MEARYQHIKIHFDVVRRELSTVHKFFFHEDSHERAVVKCLHCFLSDMIFPQTKIRRHGEKETKLNKPQGGDL